jgi:hypothetical protein
MLAAALAIAPCAVHSEVAATTANQAPVSAESGSPCRQTNQTASGTITIDACDTPELQEWSARVLCPIVREWYPRIAALLPVEGFTPPREVSIRFDPGMKGVAATSGTRISCAADWFRANLQGEAAGSVVHELVHVVQQYGGSRPGNPEPHRAPGWLVEGIADYIRWFLYEPQSHGADAVWIRRVPSAKLHFDAGYRQTANFLDWVTRTYDRELVRKLNIAGRNQTYRKDLWKEFTGHTLDELGADWLQQVVSQRGEAVK